MCTYTQTPWERLVMRRKRKGETDLCCLASLLWKQMIILNTRNSCLSAFSNLSQAPWLPLALGSAFDHPSNNQASCDSNVAIKGLSFGRSPSPPRSLTTPLLHSVVIKTLWTRTQAQCPLWGTCFRSPRLQGWIAWKIPWIEGAWRATVHGVANSWKALSN